STFTMPPARRSRPRRCGGSPNSTKSRRASAAARPTSAPASARRRPGHWVDAMKKWLEGELSRVSAKSILAEAIRYALRHWKGLGLFLKDGRVEIDSNT